MFTDKSGLLVTDYMLQQERRLQGLDSPDGTNEVEVEKEPSQINNFNFKTRVTVSDDPSVPSSANPFCR